MTRAQQVLELGIANGTHIGAQLYVSRHGEVVADLAVGEADDGVPMTTDSMMIWFSMTKAVTAVAVAQLWERGALDIEAPIVRYIPEFAPHGKDRITLRHVLTHTAGIPNADGILDGTPWRESNTESIARICDAPLEYEPGTRAGYHAAAGMTILGEVVARVSGTPYERYVREEIFLPLDMDDCYVGMPPDVYAAYGKRIGRMHATAAEEPQPVGFVDTPRAAANPMPGGNGRGPVNQLARMYERMEEILGPVTIAAVSARHRTQMLDETYGIVVDYGLGFAIDTAAMGRHSSTRAFGHPGHLSSIAFRDPEHDVVVAMVFNGMPDRDTHNMRLAAVSTALYVDMDIARETDEGRAKPFPAQGL